MAPSPSETAQASPLPHTARCASIRDQLMQQGLFHLPQAEGHEGFASTWRISPLPYLLTPSDVQFFQTLGPILLAFYRALNRLYQDSVRGTQPGWIAGYLDQGKPESLIAFSRMNRFKSLIPSVIRPDVLQTDRGMVITELDSVPGGIGLTGCLGRLYHAYSANAYHIVGGADGMVSGFSRMARHLLSEDGGLTGIVVSDEARDYRPEMHWLAREVTRQGLDCACLAPRDLAFTEEGLWTTWDGHERRIRLLYRFFELFDLKNIPKIDLILYSIKKDLVAASPPVKPPLEEKSALALFHHPVLAAFWRRELGEERVGILASLFPMTWVLDPAPVPPSAVIPNLTLGTQPVTDWRSLQQAGQRDRQLVLKPSGFSELAWGSRGVSIGHDLSQPEWAQALDTALEAFAQTPYVLQRFHKARSQSMTYDDPGEDRLLTMQGRARLCPYYFVVGDEVELGGILATICPADKKILHGMRDAILAPCAIEADLGAQ